MLDLMLQVRLKQAKNALRDGRLDEAFAIAGEKAVREHRGGQVLLEQLVKPLLERAARNLADGRPDDARIDVERAISAGGSRPEALELRRKIDEALHARRAENRRDVDLVESARKGGFPYHLGLTATAPGFYGAQARNVPGFKPRDEELPEKLAEMNVANFEMEASVLFTLATLRGFRAGAVCAVYATRRENEFIDVDTKDLAEKRCIETGLGAFEVLELMDEASGDSGSWSPSMGLKEK